MKFNDLTEKQIEYIKGVYTKKSKLSWEKRAHLLSEEFGVTERTIRRWVSENFKLKEKEDVVPEQYLEAQSRKFDKTKKRFIITWGQNNTDVHQGFYENMEAYAKHIDADIHIILGRYKNPTSVFEDVDHDFWVDEVDKYKDANRHSIHKFLSVMSDITLKNL